MDACPGARTEAAVGVPSLESCSRAPQGTQGSLAAEELVSCCQVAPAPSSPTHPPKALVGSRRRAQCPHPTSCWRLEPAQWSQARNLEVRTGHQGGQGLGAGARGGTRPLGAPPASGSPAGFFPKQSPAAAAVEVQEDRGRAVPPCPRLSLATHPPVTGQGSWGAAGVTHQELSS